MGLNGSLLTPIKAAVSGSASLGLDLEPSMNRDPSDARTPQRPLLRRAVWGMASALLGFGLVSAMLAVTYGRTPFLERALFQLGLAGTPLVAALGQVLILMGLAMLWSALHRQR